MKIDGKIFQLTNVELKKLFKLNKIAHPVDADRMQLLDIYRANIKNIKRELDE